jgi:hypothetical protein
MAPQGGVTAMPTSSDEPKRKLILRVSSRRDIEAGLPAALELAAALRSKLAALFVTEDASIAASGLPFPAMMGFSGGALTVDPHRFEAAIRREAESCRRALADAAERARLVWTFEALRGETSRLLREASADEDILVIGIDRLGSPAAEMIASARGLAPRRGGVMLVPERTARRQGPLVTIEGDEAAGSLANFAAALAEALGTRLAHAALSREASGSEAAVLATARLLLARLENPMLGDPAAVRRILAGLRSPLLLLRTESDEG